MHQLAIHFMSIIPTIPEMWPMECLTIKKPTEPKFWKTTLAKNPTNFQQNFNHLSEFVGSSLNGWWDNVQTSSRLTLTHTDTHTHRQWQYPKVKGGLGWKGPIHLAGNYQPVTQTCIYSKLMEHIMVSHGSLSSLFCETQLLVLHKLNSLEKSTHELQTSSDADLNRWSLRVVYQEQYQQDLESPRDLCRCETIFWPPYILTPGSIYRTIFWPRGQYIVTIFWPPSRYFDPPPNIVYKTVLLFMDNY